MATQRRARVIRRFPYKEDEKIFEEAIADARKDWGNSMRTNFAVALVGLTSNGKEFDIMRADTLADAERIVDDMVGTIERKPERYLYAFSFHVQTGMLQEVYGPWFGRSD